MPAAIIISSGDRFGKLTVIAESNMRGKNRYFSCICDCGVGKEISLKSLRNVGTKSCGCAQIDHAKKLNFKNGLYKTRLHRIWENMKQRCYNQNAPRYKNYGGKGVSICSDWLGDFKKFHDWAINNGYHDELSIDRINVDGNYEPGNCRWATDFVQQNNRINNRLKNIECN